MPVPLPGDGSGLQLEQFEQACTEGYFAEFLYHHFEGWHVWPASDAPLKKTHLLAQSLR